MIRSMTGFASVSREGHGARLSVTAKSVNHRFLDTQVKASQALAPIDSRLRALVQAVVTRGRVELSIGLEHTAPPPREVVLDEALLEQVAAAIDAVRAKGVVTGTLSASDALRIPQVIDIRPKVEAGGAGLAPELADLAIATLGDALAALVVMRETEGRFLQTDLDARLATIEALVGELESLARSGQQSLADRLRERLADLPQDLVGDPTALAQEVEVLGAEVLAHHADQAHRPEARRGDAEAGGDDGDAQLVAHALVDDGAEARALIRENVAALGLGGTSRIFRRDATKLGAAHPVEPFSLVFLDPPYGQGLAEKALASARDGGWLTPDALIVVEEMTGSFKAPDGFEEIERRTYDDTELVFLRTS